MSSALPAAAGSIDALVASSARAHPARAALVLPRPLMGERTTLFAALDRRVDAVAAGLQAAGLLPDQRAALLVPPTEDFFVLVFALLRLGAVPVLVDPGIGRRHLRTCLGEAEPRAFLGVAAAHLARRVLRWCPGAELAVTVGRAPGPGPRLAGIEAAGRALQPWQPPARAPGATAAVVFTSGSTGVPKGVEQTQENLLAQVAAVASLYHLGPDDVSLATFPVFALFGPPLGMTTVVPRMDPTKPAQVRPARVLTAARRHRATVLFGSPALLDTVTRGALSSSAADQEAGPAMPTVRRVISAGAPVSRRIQRATLTLLPAGAQVFSPYGATEALPVTSIGSDELLALPADGICIGRPVPGVDVALMAITDDPVAELTPDLLVAAGETGEVVVRGDVVTTRYLGRPDATAAAKLRWGGQVAHRMGDLASLDADGRLWFAGRKAHRVATADGPLYSVPCEEVFNAHPQVRRTALVGLGSRGREVPVLCVQLEPGVAGSPALTAELLALGAVDDRTRAISRVRYHPGFPVDIRHNAKIDRPALAAWAAGR